MQSRIGLGPVEMLAPKPRWAAGAAEQAELLDLVADRFDGHLVYRLAAEPLRLLHGFDERAITADVQRNVRSFPLQHQTLGHTEQVRTFPNISEVFGEALAERTRTHPLRGLLLFGALFAFGFLNQAANDIRCAP
jgi:hypothetical protein